MALAFMQVVKEVVKRELLQGEDIETIFSSFDTEPLGSASIAQVTPGQPPASHRSC